MMDLETLETLLAMGESLEREFKSDRGRFSDRAIYEEIIAFANTAGGVLLVGVEDDGRVTGARPSRLIPTRNLVPRQKGSHCTG